MHSREANEPSKTLRATEAPTQKAAGAITPAQHGATAHAPALKGRSAANAAMAPQLPPLTRLHPLLHSTSKAALAKGLFGSLRFPNSGAGAAAKFVRLAHSEAHPTSPADVLDLMSETWGMELPNALISILDSSPRPTPNPGRTARARART